MLPVQRWEAVHHRVVGEGSCEYSGVLDRALKKKKIDGKNTRYSASLKH